MIPHVKKAKIRNHYLDQILPYMKFKANVTSDRADWEKRFQGDYFTEA